MAHLQKDNSLLDWSANAVAGFWSQRGFDAQGHRYNPSEKKLSIHNVSGLANKWAFASGGSIDCAIAITHDHVFLEISTIRSSRLIE